MKPKTKARAKKPLQVGDTVRLNSGSPKLVVTDFIYDGRVVVEWIGAEGKMQSAILPRPCVHRVTRYEATR
jgi:uncharacterized protein YodC (DUF2158 family)